MKKLNLPLTVLITGLIAGTLDILSAIFILAGGNAIGTLKYIASGAFGKAALEGGNEMVVYGLIFHYIIATCWTTAFILLYPKLKLLHWNKWLNAIAYGLIVQTLMSFVVLPLTNIAPRTFNLWGFTKNALILMYAIGLPAALMAAWFYKKEESL
ncbi:MAG: hypothetical protein K1X72_15165 [Pyrinomonadaceae bacterium]|nr:hypothetical protein [Pyrinomonadaceae bacterium]